MFFSSIHTTIFISDVTETRYNTSFQFQNVYDDHLRVFHSWGKWLCAGVLMLKRVHIDAKSVNLFYEIIIFSPQFLLIFLADLISSSSIHAEHCSILKEAKYIKKQRKNVSVWETYFRRIFVPFLWPPANDRLGSHSRKLIIGLLQGNSYDESLQGSLRVKHKINRIPSGGNILQLHHTMKAQKFSYCAYAGLTTAISYLRPEE